MSSSASAGLITWSPYSGTAAVLVALILLVIGAGCMLLGWRSKKAFKFPVPGRAVKVVIVVVWVTSILTVHTLLNRIAVESGQSSLDFGPVFPITIASAIGTFFLVAYLTRRGGALAALGNGFAAAVAGPMVFELPFVLIITPVVVTTHISHPLFLLTVLLVVVLTTLALPLFSSRFAVTRYSLYSLGAMLLVFALWALLTGYAPPTDPVSFFLNAVSKVLGFIAVVSCFVTGGGGRALGQAL